MSILKELLALKEAAEEQEETPAEGGGETVELSTFKGERIPYESWPEGVTYKGMNVFNTVYEGKGDKTLAADFKHLVQDRFEDSEGGKLNAQESYLGYSPHKDLFVMGFDGWAEIPGDPDYEPDEEFGDDGSGDDETVNVSPYLAFKILSNGSIDTIDYDADIAQNGKMWYGKNGGHAQAKARWPDLIDVRLD